MEIVARTVENLINELEKFSSKDWSVETKKMLCYYWKGKEKELINLINIRK